MLRVVAAACGSVCVYTLSWVSARRPLDWRLGRLTPGGLPPLSSNSAVADDLILSAEGLARLSSSTSLLAPILTEAPSAHALPESEVVGACPGYFCAGGCYFCDIITFVSVLSRL